MNSDQYELILIFVSVIIGVLSATYFYVTAGEYARLKLFQSSLKFISLGMFVISVGVLLAAFINYEAKLGYDLYLYSIPLQAFFYLLYIIGSIFIMIGVRKFTSRPSEKIIDVSL